MEQMEDVRGASLLEAQTKAAELFDAVSEQGIIRAGRLETEINADIYGLAERMYGITKYWHKRIVRAGQNTLRPYDDNPPDIRTTGDDILFLDLGPVFEEWEADFGRTYVIGNDPVKQKLRRDVEEGFAKGKKYFQEHPEITGAELFAYAQQLARDGGWEFGGQIAGHLIGQFPHERIPEDKVTLYSHPDNHRRMRSVGPDGKDRHWILEIHFVDRERRIGGFYEELLTV